MEKNNSNKPNVVSFDSTKELLDKIQIMIDEDNEKFPSENHEEKFLTKLRSKVKKRIDLIPYFIKLLIAVFILYFLAVVIPWYDIKYGKPSKILTTIEKLKK